MRFDVLPLRLEFTAQDRLHFPVGKAANLLRGAFGMALARAGTDGARFFDPRQEGGPSGLADPPRPFVFRVRNLDGAEIGPGERFEVGINLFQVTEAARELVTRAFTEAARDGFGPGRGRAELTGTSGEVVALDLAPASPAPPRIRVAFLSPTELKHDGRIAERPSFAILAARARDRVAALRALYGAGTPEIDFAGFGERAGGVRMMRCELREVAAQRRSSRTGQTHPIGGFTGMAEYEGALGEFLPFLEAARWTGVGRQAVWGKGELALSRIM